MQSKLKSPVRTIPADARRAGPEEGTALCLSGGGYRAMLFHLGALWRLNEWGYLPQLARISSVSGGSIVAAILGRSWGRLDFDGGGVAASFDREVVKPVRRLAGQTIDRRAIGLGMFLPGSINRRVIAAYRRHVFVENETLQDLPAEGEGPRFVINATNLQSGVLWRFSRPYAWDYKVGKIENPTIPLATAVAASSAFPPFLSPARLRFAESDFTPASGESLQSPPFTTRPVLTDGGVYDNLGLETAWKRYRSVLISDGGGALAPADGGVGLLRAWRWRDWGTQSVRVLFSIDNQVRSLRKRQAISAFASTGPEHRDGTYWGIRSGIADYELDSSLACPPDAVDELAAVPTRLKKLEPALQERLINWGYAICDAAMRRWVDESLAKPAGFPYPDRGVGS